ncbi:UDP-glucose 4-epimerase GalE [Mesonia sp. K7]|uniref:UDP-glucose 4-epimerase GalE n=1 Tax=Mesonia sp. K7 TaxID=2218606 RepID=UPI000DA8EED1|nr:UDP-glucose 4-epimerase GalE [Mesonia sp. K7]PZD79320.1 UDP-glucose 4-epimerase GalE [Mesonia sp. K7]
MKVLVTGGLGFIGSHTAVELLNNDYDVVLVDNLSNSSLSVLEGIAEITGKTPAFHKIDLREPIKIQELFDEHPDIEGVIHFAASKAVGESVEKPLLYYENNINALVFLLKEMQKREISNFIFSSSCTVYGQADELPIKENAPIKKAESPYGNTKKVGENILEDLATADKNFKAISLRYFNPIGAHESALIGELPIGTPQNLIPYITQTMAGVRKELSVFGDDYPTPDGTAIRDYIYVVDLAIAHVVALKRLIENNNKANYEIFNLGTGKGNSVLEVINAFEDVTQQKLPYKIVARREGDVTAAYADTQRAKEELGWQTQYDIKHALKTAWKWQQKQ